MPRFALTFDYPGRHGETFVGKQSVERDSIEEAAEHIASQRPGGPSSIHIRTSNGESVNRLFTFGPSEKVA